MLCQLHQSQISVHDPLPNAPVFQGLQIFLGQFFLGVFPSQLPAVLAREFDWLQLPLLHAQHQEPSCLRRKAVLHYVFVQPQVLPGLSEYQPPVFAHHVVGQALTELRSRLEKHLQLCQVYQVYQVSRQ